MRLASIDEAERQEGDDRIVEFVRWLVPLGGEQGDTFFGAAEIAQGAGELDGGPSAANSLKTVFQRLPVERLRLHLMAGRILRRGSFEHSDGMSCRQFGGKGIDAGDKGFAICRVEGCPEFGQPSLPVSPIDGVYHGPFPLAHSWPEVARPRGNVKPGRAPLP